MGLYRENTVCTQILPGSPLNETLGGLIQHWAGVMPLTRSRTALSRLPRVRSWKNSPDEYSFSDRPAYSLCNIHVCVYVEVLNPQISLGA